MRRLLLILVPLLACGGALSIAAFRTRPSPRPDDTARARAARLEAAARRLAGARERRDRLAAEAERLEKAARGLRERLGDAASPETPGAPSEADPMETLLRNVTALQNEEKVRTLTARLNLGPAQTDRLKALLDEDVRKMLESVRAGGWQAGPAGSEASWMPDFRRLLTNEQAAAYDAYEAEERARREALRVDMDASVLEDALDLKPDQTGAVKALFRKDPSLLGTVTFHEDLHPSTLPADLRARDESAAGRLKGALAPLLDPDQAAALDTYLRDKAAQRLEMLELVRAFYGPSEK